MAEKFCSHGDGFEENTLPLTVWSLKKINPEDMEMQSKETRD